MSDQQLAFESKTFEVKISETFSLHNRIVLYSGETDEFLRTVPDNCIMLSITSPPYNIGKEYELTTSIKNYLAQQEKVINELVRIMHESGSICWQVGNYVKNGEVFPLDIFYYNLFKNKGLKLRNRIVWHFGHGLHASKRFSGRYETILWFTKSDKYVFNLDPVRIPTKYPGKRHYKGENRGKISGNPLGKNPSDIWEFVAKEWDKELWDIPNPTTTLRLFIISQNIALHNSEVFPSEFPCCCDITSVCSFFFR